MMKKLFISNECLKKRCTRIAAVMAGLVMAVSICTPMHAEAGNPGEVDGHPCYASLTVNGSTATASTTSSLNNAYHYVKVTYCYYYTDGNGNSQMDTSEAQASNSHSVTAVAYAHGSNIRKIYAISNHKVDSGSGQPWGHTINE